MIFFGSFHYDSLWQKDESDDFTFDELDANAMYMIPQFCMMLALSKPAGRRILVFWGWLLENVHRWQILVWTGVFLYFTST